MHNMLLGGNNDHTHSHTHACVHTHTLSLSLSLPPSLSHSLTHCIGLQHVPVGPLTPEQEALAKIAFYQSNQQHSSSGEAQLSMGLSGAIQRHTSGSHVKAFSGKGHTLSSSSSSDHTPSSSGGHTLSSTSSIGSSGSGSGLASGSRASRVGPSGPGRGGGGAAVGAAIGGGRGRGRFVSGGTSGSVGDSGVGGVSRLVQQRTPAERDDQIQAHNQVFLLLLVL